MSKHIKDFTVEDVCNWCHKVGYGAAADTFKACEVNGRFLLEMTHSDLTQDLAFSDSEASDLLNIVNMEQQSPFTSITGGAPPAAALGMNTYTPSPAAYTPSPAARGATGSPPPRGMFSSGPDPKIQQLQAENARLVSVNQHLQVENSRFKSELFNMKSMYDQLVAQQQPGGTMAPYTPSAPPAVYQQPPAQPSYQSLPPAQPSYQQLPPDRQQPPPQYQQPPPQYQQQPPQYQQQPPQYQQQPPQYQQQPPHYQQQPPPDQYQQPPPDQYQQPPPDQYQQQQQQQDPSKKQHSMADTGMGVVTGAAGGALGGAALGAVAGAILPDMDAGDGAAAGAAMGALGGGVHGFMKKM